LNLATDDRDRRRGSGYGAGVVVAICILAFFFAGMTAQHAVGPVQRGFMFRVKQANYWLRAPRTKDPLPATGAAVDAGQAVYANQCSSCHDADGKGTALGLSFYPQATDLTTKYAQGYSDRELYYLLWNGIGHTGMPKWDTQLQSEQVWQVIHFMRTMPASAKPGPAGEPNLALIAEGHQLFKTQGCTECHSVEGKPADSPDLTYEGDRGRSRAWLIGHLIVPDAYSPGSDMPSFGKLTGAQLDALAVFLNSLKRGNALKNHNSGM